MARPEPQRVERVAVLGAGTIGASWAAQFLAAGMDVVVHDPAPDTENFVRGFVDRAWPALERLRLAPGADPRRIAFEAEPGDAVRNAHFVQESVPESLDVKRALYERMEAGLPPDAVVASSTSGIMPSDLQAGRQGPERYLVGHPFNPPHLIPLVEVVGGKATDPAVVRWAAGLYESMGKRPIVIKKEVPGHVANRMQVALYREAIHLVLEGVARIEDVDAAIAYGPGPRWALMGPHMQHHLAGGVGGIRHHLEHIGPGMQRWWDDLGAPRMSQDVIDRIVDAFEATNPPAIETLAAERDALQVSLLETLSRMRSGLEETEASPEA